MKALPYLVNEHLKVAIREAFFAGVNHGLEVGRRIINDKSLTKEEQNKETTEQIEKLTERFLVKEEKK